MTAAWFEQEIQEKIEKKSGELKGTWFIRCLNRDNEIEKTRFKNNLYIGSLAEILTDEGMYDAIINFWKPQDKEMTYERECYTGSGNLKEDIVTRRMHRNGFSDSKNKKYKQKRIFIKELGWAGYSDMLCDINLVKYYGSKTVKGEKPKKKDIRVLEYKETSVFNYKKWQTFQDLPANYRVQPSIYAKYFFENGVTKTDKGHLLVFTRDSPKTCRPLDFEPDYALIKNLEEKTREFWDHIRNRTIPKGFVFPEEEFIGKYIKYGKDLHRTWPELSGVQ